jgi:hypothetical protein
MWTDADLVAAALSETATAIQWPMRIGYVVVFVWWVGSRLLRRYRRE